MTFDEVKSYLTSLDKYGSILGLSNMRALLKLLNNPQNDLKIIHITGTNGKGSVSAYLSFILKEAGFSTGVYNSPAVICEYDQYKINGEITDKAAFSHAVSIVKEQCDILNKKNIFPTRFEVETAAAFILFKNEKVESAIIETGLGGKDDATAVIDNAILYIFTSISKDHIPVLGKNIKEIAENKSHIIKSSAPTVIYKTDETSFDVIKKRCKKFDSRLYAVCPEDIEKIEYKDGHIDFEINPEKYSGLHNITSSLSGSYQPYNALCAIQASLILRSCGFEISDDAVLSGIKKCHISFRFEKLCDNPAVIADGAHNPDGARMLIKSIENNYPGYSYIFVTGIFKDKDYESICKITGSCAKKVYAVCNDLSPRSLDAFSLANILKKYNTNVETCGTIEEGIKCAFDAAEQSDNTIVVLFGSLSWLQRAREIIETVR